MINDRLVKLREDFSISCVEFAPKIFKFIRKIDGVSEESIVNSMLTMNNKTGINETEGRGGSFFVNSDDREFIIKTITFEEMELRRKLLLTPVKTSSLMEQMHKACLPILLQLNIKHFLPFQLLKFPS